MLIYDLRPKEQTTINNIQIRIYILVDSNDHIYTSFSKMLFMLALYMYLAHIHGFVYY